MEDFFYSGKIRELILMSYFTRYLQRLVKFCQRRKKWEVDSASKLREQSGFTVSWKYCLNLCSLRRLKEAGCEKFTQIYLRLPMFGKCLKWVFQVCFRRFPVGRDSLKVKTIIKVKFLWIIAVTVWRGWVCSWKNAEGMFFVVPWVRLWSHSYSTMPLFVFVKTMAISFVI